jgi:hypothetical protein
MVVKLPSVGFRLFERVTNGLTPDKSGNKTGE